MKKIIFILLMVFTIAACSIFSCSKKIAGPEKAIAHTLLEQVNRFTSLCGKIQAAVNTSAGSKQLQDLFLRARLLYKKMEWASEYFDPTTSRFVNGAPVPDVELSGHIFKPAGLQVIEGLLYPAYDTSHKKELISQLILLQSNCNKYTSYFNNIDLFDWQVFDAVKLEIFRIETLGITGFDDPLSLKSMQECAASLQSIQEVITQYTKENPENIAGAFTNAVNYLLAHTDFNSFDRAAFITRYGDSITTDITKLEKQLSIHIIKYNRLLNQDAKSLFDTNAYNVNAYAPEQAFFISDKKANLGKLLFADPILSGTGRRSCQSCHQPDKAFTDGLIKNSNIDNTALLQRNTPTLINAALQPAQFYDLRVNTLEDQSLTVVQNVLEMHGSMKLSVQKLWQNNRYRQLFSSAFPKQNRTEIDTLEVMNAIGSYIRSLTLLNSRFDEYMRGNKTALNSREISGFNLFMGKAKCATCHYMPLFNGTLPPRYMKIESEVIGVPQSSANKEIDGDMGRYNIVKTESYKHAFKIPSLRNAARTAPYMHNGIYNTLNQVMDFYNRGGGAGLGLKIDNQTLPSDSLNLSKTESDNIIAFIKSLDSR